MTEVGDGMAFGRDQITWNEVLQELQRKQCVEVKNPVERDCKRWKRDSAITYWIWKWREYHIRHGETIRIEPGFHAVRYEYGRDANYYREERARGPSTSERRICCMRVPTDAKPAKCKLLGSDYLVYRDDMQLSVWVCHL